VAGELGEYVLIMHGHTDPSEWYMRCMQDSGNSAMYDNRQKIEVRTRMKGNESMSISHQCLPWEGKLGRQASSRYRRACELHTDC
jgi:hypothetical protein